MKRLVVCCDGTWQRLESPYATNVERIAQAVKSQTSDGVPQMIYYHEGLGTWDRIDKWLGGAFGIGIDQHIQQAYLFLALNYDPGDEVYFFGFSRGAYTVRSLAGMLNRCGLVTEQNIRKIPEAYQRYRLPKDLPSEQQLDMDRFRATHCIPCEILLIGCFDTVGSLGVPSQIPWLPLEKIVNNRLRFHDTTISKIVKHALHACAIDEQRRSFNVTPMVRDRLNVNQSVEQMWFVGDHGCVGGGDAKKVLLSNIALHWMITRVKELGLGLELDFSAQPDSKEMNPLENFLTDRRLIYHLTGSIDRVIDPQADAIHESALKRFTADGSYQPLTLVRALLDQAGFKQKD
jgi:uncharacterized protein (DUF2235 family)